MAGIVLSNEQLQCLFCGFDSDRSGSIDTAELISKLVLQSTVGLERSSVLGSETISVYEFASMVEAGRQYTVIEGQVLDVASYLRRHPGGSELIERHIGGDATEAFTKVHRKSKRAKKIVKRLTIGPLGDDADKATKALPAPVVDVMRRWYMGQC